MKRFFCVIFIVLFSISLVGCINSDISEIKTYNEVSYTWDNNFCTAKVLLKGNPDYQLNETVEGIKEFNDATCTKNMSYLYKAKFNNELFKDQVSELFELENTALGHDLEKKWTIDVEPTKTSDGLRSHHCKRCNERINETAIDKGNNDSEFDFWLTDDGYYVSGYIENNKKNVIIPEFHYGIPVVGIIAYSFSATNIESIKIPSSVKIIEEGAFRHCLNLKTVIIESGCEKIGNQAFAWCENLKDVSLGDGLIEIGNGCFMNNSSLTNINLPSSLKKIGKSAFHYCSSLDKISVPNGITHIEESTFDYCISLSDITLPQNLYLISEYAFRNCKSLEVINLPNNLEIIDRYAFADCKSIKSILIPYNVTSLGSSIFDGCSSLECIFYDGMTLNTKMTDNWSYDYTSIIFGNKIIYYFSETYKESHLNVRYWHYVDGVPTSW